MALVDDPKAFILRMFQMEVREGRGQHCQVSESEGRPIGLPLEEGELVYGVYKDKYFFSPQSLIVRDKDCFQRLEWSQISSCSTRHGDGKKTSTLTLVSGKEAEIKISDLATGWEGRVSQLFHKMIERWGAQAFTGLPLMSIDSFFAAATDKYSFAPNIEPHPTLEQIKAELVALSQRVDVHQVWVSVKELEGTEPIATEIVVVSSSPLESFEEFRKSLSATSILAASENTLRKIDLNSESRIWEIVWS
jgi:hypothetical protein